jgi:hypothetical protein
MAQFIPENGGIFSRRPEPIPFTFVRLQCERMTRSFNGSMESRDGVVTATSRLATIERFGVTRSTLTETEPATVR